MRHTVFTCGRFALDLQSPLVMGILNITPDSFSDGGKYASVSDVLKQAEQMLLDGATILDIGAESTRPGADKVDEHTEWVRLEPILKELVQWKVPISLDSYKPAIMQRGIACGVDLINDVQGFRTDAAIEAVKASAVGLCIMHQLNDSAQLPEGFEYANVHQAVSDFFLAQVERMQAQKIALSRMVIDPGFGFAKSLENNYQLMHGLAAIAPQSLPLLVGVSRKNMIGRVVNRPVNERLSGSLALALAAVQRGARIVRVHDVRETVDALKVWSAVETAGCSLQ